MAAPVFISATLDFNSGGTTVTTSHTVATGTDRLLTVRASLTESTGTEDVTGVTWGGTALTHVVTIDAGTVRQELWRLIAPVETTANVITTANETISEELVHGIRNYTGVDQSTPLGTAVTASGTSTTPSVTVSSNSNDLIEDGINSINATATVGASQTERYNGATANRAAGSEQAGGSSVVLDWTLSSSLNWASIGVALKEVVTATIEQEGYRWYNDDGSESGMTAAAAQDTTLSGAANTNFILRALLNATGDPASAQFQLEYDADAGSDWRKVGVGSASAAFSVQHLTPKDVAATSATDTITAVTLASAVCLLNNNRKQTGGPNGSSANQGPNDMGGQIDLTGTTTLTYTQDNTNTRRYAASIWEYIGAASGANEFVVRDRRTTTLSSATRNTTYTPNNLSSISNRSKCVAFITGITNPDTGNNSNGVTAIAYLNSSGNVFVERGGATNTTDVEITVVEFTGANWTVHYGYSASQADTGTLTLRDDSDGQGGATSSVGAWANAFIVGDHRGNDADVDEAISDNYPVFDPGGTTGQVDWTFNANHNVSTTNEVHFVQIVENSGMTVTRFQDTASAAGESTVDITSAGLSNITEALVIGSSISSGGGTAFGRGWRNYYFNSTIEVAHWCHRSGNTMAHEIQIIELPQDTSTAEWDIAASSNITASGEDTTARLTAPSGKTTGDFDAGRIQDDENPADAVDVTADNYTEIAWCIKSDSAATGTWKFRVTKSGTVINTYTVTPKFTISVGGAATGKSNPLFGPLGGPLAGPIG